MGGIYSIDENVFVFKLLGSHFVFEYAFFDIRSLSNVLAQGRIEHAPSMNLVPDGPVIPASGPLFAV